MEKNIEFIKILNREWLRRQKVNRRYSLRAFAASLSVSPSRLSDFLNGKGGISANRALELAERLNFSNEDLASLHLIIQKELPSAKSVKKFASASLRQRRKKFSYARSVACRKTIESLRWEHLYIAEILSARPLTQNQIAQRLRLHPDNLRMLLLEAQNLELITSVPDQRDSWQAQDSSRRFGDAKASANIRKLHYQMLNQVQKFCENCDHTDRELSSNLLQLDQSQVEKLKSMIQDFAKTCLAEGNKSKDLSRRLYGISIQLFPIENKKEIL